MSKFFINRPIVAMVIAILMVIVGGVSIFTLPTAQFPNIVPPEIQVRALYVGADALTVEQSVATPIEQQMSGVDNMNYMYSTNANNGQMVLTVNFDIKTDPNIDQVLTQLRQAQAAAQIPAEVTNNGISDLNANNGQMVLTVNFDIKTDPNIDQVLTQLRQAQAAAQIPAEVTNNGI